MSKLTAEQRRQQRVLDNQHDRARQLRIAAAARLDLAARQLADAHDLAQRADKADHAYVASRVGHLHDECTRVAADMRAERPRQVISFDQEA